MTKAKELLNMISEKFIKVVRKGKVIRKLAPRKGYTIKGGKYVKVNPAEARKRSISAKKAARKRKGKKSQTSRARKISLKKRKAAGL